MHTQRNARRRRERVIQQERQKESWKCHNFMSSVLPNSLVFVPLVFSEMRGSGRCEVTLITWQPNSLVFNLLVLRYLQFNEIN